MPRVDIGEYDAATGTGAYDVGEVNVEFAGAATGSRRAFDALDRGFQRGFSLCGVRYLARSLCGGVRASRCQVFNGFVGFVGDDGDDREHWDFFAVLGDDFADVAAFGDSYSKRALSVSRSRRMSPLLTRSPSLTRHSTTVPLSC